MNTEWKQLSGIEEVTAARDAGMEIEVDILDEWKPWSGEFDTLLAQVWFKDLKFRARPREPKVETYDDQIDAARYRWLRKRRKGMLTVSLFGNHCKTIEDVDSMIDALIGDEKGESAKLAKVLVKRICWTSTGGNLTWTNEDYQFYSKDWKRFNAGDIEGEVDA
jgi:hypothetical protein